MFFLKKKKDNRNGGGTTPPPRHIGIIMDGNGRWATKRGLVREAGHKKGAETFKKVVEYCISRDIGLVTVYAFSTENWRRPESEVEGIINLLVDYLDDVLNNEQKTRCRVRFIGDVTRFSPEIQEKMRKCEEGSRDYPNALNVALNYGGRADIVQAVNKLISEGCTRVAEEDISNALYTYSQPDPDLIIRTGGEMRLSNFLTWQSAYSELYFTDKLWPDITNEDIDKALEFYSKRQRRFGDVKPRSTVKEVK